MKTCTNCKQSKAPTEFHKCHRVRDGLVAKCKSCRKATRKKRYEKNPEKELAVNRKYRKKNIEKVRAHDRERYEQNPEKRREMIRKCHQRPEYKKRNNALRKERRKTEPEYRLTCNLRRRLHSALKGNTKSASTMVLLGCTIEHLRDHLTKHFQTGMTWDNQGTWHVDHMLACASFDLSDPEQQRRCFHWTNLQPLWGLVNSSKGAGVWYKGEWDSTIGWVFKD